MDCFRTAVLARFGRGSDSRRLLLQLASRSLETNRYFIFEIFYDFFANDFCMFVAFEEITPVERQGYTFCFARTIRYLGPRPAYRAMLDRDLALNGPSVWHAIATGHIDWLGGNHGAADEAYRYARDLAMAWGVTPYHFDCGIMTWLTQSEAEKLLVMGTLPAPALPTSNFVFDEESISRGAEIVFVIGCDAGYFRFVPTFLASVLRSRQMSGSRARVAVHCHIANPQDHQLAFLRELAAWLRRKAPELTVGFSFNDATYKERAYYTCLRFLVLPEVLRRYGCGAIAVDVDSAITPEFFRSLELLKSHSFGLRAYTFPPNSRKQHNGEPWAIGAHPTYVECSDQGLKFASFLQHYVQTAYDPKLLTNWCIDQCAIGRAYDLMIGDDVSIRLLNFAHVPSLYELPDDFGGKEEFITHKGSISTENFHIFLTELTN